MAILNSNEIILSDSGLTLTDSVIIGHDFSGSCRVSNILNIKMQVHFFTDIAKWEESINNALKVKGFNPRYNFTYDSINDIKDIMYFFDSKLKIYVMEQFPLWDPDKLIIVPQPE